MTKNRVIALTMGDPGGVGPEVLLKGLSSLKKSSHHTIVVLGLPPVFEHLREKFKLALSSPGIIFRDITEDLRKVYLEHGKKIPVRFGFDPGKVSFQNAAAAFAALKIAAREAAKGKFHAIVTAPLNKTSMRLLDSDFHGHTEYLARTSGVSKFAMMFVGNRLNVTLATIHVPIKRVPALIKRGLVLEKIILTNDFLKQRLKIKNPKIAVCALNPHGRETGTEDEKEIRPAVREAARKGVKASGPLSADQLFFDAYHKRYDAVIAMYHDQGLAPFKMIAFEDGVNVTLGLPYVRTSPDHGTAFDIAYQNKANPASMRAALNLALQLVS